MTEGYVVFTTSSGWCGYISHLLKRAPTALVSKVTDLLSSSLKISNVGLWDYSLSSLTQCVHCSLCLLTVIITVVITYSMSSLFTVLTHCDNHCCHHSLSEFTVCCAHSLWQSLLSRSSLLSRLSQPWQQWQSWQQWMLSRDASNVGPTVGLFISWDQPNVKLWGTYFSWDQSNGGMWDYSSDETYRTSNCGEYTFRETNRTAEHGNVFFREQMDVGPWECPIFHENNRTSVIPSEYFPFGETTQTSIVERFPIPWDKSNVELWKSSMNEIE
jgi:hypothetical protein